MGNKNCKPNKVFSPIQKKCVSTYCPPNQIFSPNQYQCIETQCPPYCVSTQCPPNQIFSPIQDQCISTQCPSGQTFSPNQYQCICPPGEQFYYFGQIAGNTPIPTPPTCFNPANPPPSPQWSTPSN